MIAAALCAGMMSAQAQTTPTDHSKTLTATQEGKKDCMKTTEAEWKSLGLSADQITRVKAIQDEHTKACAGMKKDDARADAMVDKHEESLKEVLTPLQFENWQKQCTAMATPKEQMPKK